MTRRNRHYNIAMAKTRISVEWAFGNMKEQWPFFVAKKFQKLWGGGRGPAGIRWLHY
jgi:hypothetical protein